MSKLSNRSDPTGIAARLKYYVNKASARNVSLEQRVKAAKEMRMWVDSELPRMSQDEISKFENDLTGLIFSLVNSTDLDERLGGITVIDQLVDLRIESSAHEPMIIRFANCFRILFQQSTSHSDPLVLELASKALGRLARAGGALTVDIVEFQVKQSLEWLQSDPGERRQLAAVLVLKELAINTPTLFNVYVSRFLVQIWVALRHNNEAIRKGGIEALRACLEDLSKREESWRQRCYRTLLEEAFHGLESNNLAVVHGSLLVIGELLRFADDFLESQAVTLGQRLVGYVNHKHPMIQRITISILPALARLSPQHFQEEHMHSLEALIGQLNGANSNPAFLAIGEIALAVGLPILGYIRPIMEVMLKSFGHVASGKKTHSAQSKSALTCVGMLARALGDHLNPYMDTLLDSMFRMGLSPNLIDALQKITKSIPRLLPSVQERLLDVICSMLDLSTHLKLQYSPVVVDGPESLMMIQSSPLRPSSAARGLQLYQGRPLLRSTHSRSSAGPGGGGHPKSTSSASSKRKTKSSASSMLLMESSSGSQRAWAGPDGPSITREQEENFTLALHTLGSFKFDFQGGQRLLVVLKEFVLPFFQLRTSLRLEAAHTCCLMLPRLAEGASEFYVRRLVFSVLKRLVGVGVSDPSALIRMAILNALDPRLDAYLAQAEILRPIFVALNDEEFAVREATISLLGRLSGRNPAVVIPNLRKNLIQLLSELQQFSHDDRRQEQSCQLLGHLISSSAALVRPYVSAILSVLVPSLAGVVTAAAGPLGANSLTTTTTGGLLGGSSSLRHQHHHHHHHRQLPTYALATLGKLAEICGQDILPYLDTLLPAVVEPVKDPGGSPRRRQVALRTLAALIGNAGFLVQPAVLYPHLMSVLLSVLRTEPNTEVRLEALGVLGTIGALDPQHPALKGISGATRRNHHPSPAAGGGTTATGQRARSVGGMLLSTGRGPMEDETVYNVPDSTLMEHYTGVLGGGGNRLTPSVGDEDDDLGGGFGGADLVGSDQSLEMHYPRVAITALLRILVDPNLVSFHSLVVKALMFIIRSLGSGAVPFLSRIIPVFLAQLQQPLGEESLRSALLSRLRHIVNISGPQYKPYLKDTFTIILNAWDTHPELSLEILKLIEALSLALPEEFKDFLPDTVPRLLQVLQHPQQLHPQLRSRLTREQRDELTSRCLWTIQTFGAQGNLEGYLYVVLPALICLAERPEELLETRVSAMRTIRKLARIQDISEHASRLIHPISRILSTAAGLTELHTQCIRVLHPLVRQLGSGFFVFEPMLRKTLESPHLTKYNRLALEKLNQTGGGRDGDAASSSSGAASSGSSSSVATSRSGGTVSGGGSVGSGLGLLTNQSSTAGGSGDTASSSSASSSAPGALKQQSSSSRSRRKTTRALTEALRRYWALVFGLCHRLEAQQNYMESGSQYPQKGFSLLTSSSSSSSSSASASHSANGSGGGGGGMPLASGRGVQDYLRIMGSSLIGGQLLLDLDIMGEESDSDSDTTEALFWRRKRMGGGGGGLLTMMDPEDSDFGMNSAGGGGAGGGTSGGGSGGSGDGLSSHPNQNLHVSQQALMKAWTAHQRSTKDDWMVWMRGFSLELLKQSPSVSLRACSALALKHPPLAQQLFNAAFMSCWNVLYDDYQDDLLTSLETTFESRTIPPEIVQPLLNLAAFMELHEQPLAIDVRTLGALAERVHAYARALFYKEEEFRTCPESTVEQLISINNKLAQPDAARGVLKFAHQGYQVALKESWHEKLGRWDNALEAYELRQLQQPEDQESVFGIMRCLRALGEWERLAELCDELWRSPVLGGGGGGDGSNWNGVASGKGGQFFLEAPISGGGGGGGGGGRAEMMNGILPSQQQQQQQLTNKSIIRRSAGGGAGGGGKMSGIGAAKLGQILEGSESGVGRQNQQQQQQKTSGGHVFRSSSSGRRSRHPSTRSSGRGGTDHQERSPGLIPGSPDYDSVVPFELEEELEIRKLVAPHMCAALSNLRRWDDLEEYVGCLPEDVLDHSFYNALLAAHQNRFQDLQFHIRTAQQLLDTELRTQITESYARAYPNFVRVQQLVELGEIQAFKQGGPEKQALIKRMWRNRLQGSQHSVEVWQDILTVRSLVMRPQEDIPTWLEFANQCRQSDRMHLSLQTLTDLLGGGTHPHALIEDLRTPPPCIETPMEILVACIKHLHSTGYERRSFLRLRQFVVRGEMDGGLKSSVYVKLGKWFLNLMEQEVMRGLLHRADPSAQSHPGLFWLSGRDPTTRREWLAGMAERGLSREVLEAYTCLEWYDHDLSLDLLRLELKEEGLDSVGPLLETLAEARELERLAGTEEEGDEEVEAAEEEEGDGGGGGEQKRMTGRKKRQKRKAGQETPESVYDVPEVLQQTIWYLKEATEFDPTNFQAWHEWALMNYRVVSHQAMRRRARQASSIASSGSSGASSGGGGGGAAAAAALLQQRGHQDSGFLMEDTHHHFSQEPAGLDVTGLNVRAHIIPAIQGFFRSIWLQQTSDQRNPDILRLLELWFEYGSNPAVDQAMRQGMESNLIDTWLAVIPQIIARIHSPHRAIRLLLHDLLSKIGEAHPQAIIYALTVAAESQSAHRKAAAKAVLENMREHSPVLVEQARLVSRELVRVAILWREMWYEAIDQASRCWYQHKDFPGMMALLRPLHEMMLRDGPQTQSEHEFHQQHGPALKEAYEWCLKFSRSRNPNHMDRAWEIYSQVFRKMSKDAQANEDSTLELHRVSPRLLQIRDTELAIPGSYRAGQPVVRIARFVPSLTVIESKQHPRKLTITGSDARSYGFLLKGHEDMRQDERVMQLFGLVNTLLEGNFSTNREDLSIHRYAVIPLSSNSGLVEWVPHCDTIHALIKDYRSTRQIILNTEQRLMVKMAPDYRHLTVIQKVEVFRHAQSMTTGNDLANVMWLKAPNAETWLERRSRYIRSLAVMSMVGYVLGLGDRHPCNLMLHRRTGKMIHIDFGDCFEVAVHRDKFPEKVPFRLTRMLVRAMEVSGIEGTYRRTCEAVMEVLRENKNSVMAILEAFAYDPLINWRLLEPPAGVDRSQDPSPDPSAGTGTGGGGGAKGDGKSTTEYQPDELDPRGDAPLPDPRHAVAESALPEDEPQLNAKAVKVIARIRSKLEGTDFADPDAPGLPTVLDVPAQVERLIQDAISDENLCQLYIGFCAFW